MKIAPILLTSFLLLAAPAWAQQRGMVDHLPTADLPTCDNTTPELYGYRVYDTDADVEKTCSEAAAAWVVSGATPYLSVTHDVIQICGDADTVNANSVYYGPNTALVANTSGFTCDINAAGNTTEATADAPAFASQAFYVVGMTCRQEADSGASIIYAVRSAGAALTPIVGCAIDGTGALTAQDCVADIQATTSVAAGATIAIQAVSASNIGANNGFICNISIAY